MLKHFKHSLFILESLAEKEFKGNWETGNAFENIYLSIYILYYISHIYIHI